MERELILRHILPKEFVEHFDLIDIASKGEQLFFSLDEKNILPPEHSDKQLESKGFVQSVQLSDFPLRDKALILRVRRRKLRDKATGKTYTRKRGLKAYGTSYTKEFASFLKGILR